MKLSCEIIRDLLPLYAEELASADSAEAVREHLQGCEGCREALAAMKHPVTVLAEEPGMRKIKKEIVRRRWLAVLCGMLSILLAVSCVGCWLFNPIYLPETVVTSVEPSAHLEGWVQIWASSPPSGYRWLSCDGRELVRGKQYVAFYTCRFMELMQERPFEEYVSVRPGRGSIWLFSESGSLVPIHNGAEGEQPPEQWLLLEKLSLWSAVSGGVLVALGLLLRKKWALSMGALGSCYALCQWMVCGGSMLSFFWKRELLWAVLITGCLWGIGMCLWGMRRKK